MALGKKAASKVNKIIGQFELPASMQKMNNNNPGQEVLLYGEEHTRIGGTQVSKKTIIHKTDDQLVFDNFFLFRIDQSNYDVRGSLKRTSQEKGKLFGNKTTGIRTCRNVLNQCLFASCP